MSLRHFLDLGDAGSAAIAAILSDAAARKKARAGWPKGKADADAPLDGHVLAMIFEKNSTRTRVSFDMAMRQLGGSALVLDGASSQLGRGESVADTARVLSRYVDAIMIRTDYHDKAVELAKFASIPVISGLTNASHPCQLLADMQAVIERKGKLAGTRWAWLGDGNNVCHSLIEAALGPYRVDEALMDAAAPGAMFLHCLPAHRGEEVTDAVIDGPRSAVWDEAENRLHAQKSLLLWALRKL